MEIYYQNKANIQTNIKPRIVLDVTSTLSSSRIISTGDFGGKGITMKKFKNQLVPCPICGKPRSSNKLKHLPRPCTRFKEEHPEFVGAQSLVMLSKSSFKKLSDEGYISDDEQNLLKDINENTLIEYEKEEVIENEKGEEV